MRTLRLFVATAALLTVSSPALAAEEVPGSELIADSAEWSGVEVVVEGELIGDYGFRDDGSMWTQLNDDAYSRDPILETGQPVGGNVGIGVRMPAGLAEGLGPPGGYRNRGPLVRVTGVWTHHDVDRQGESFLRVEALVVIEPGRALGEAPSGWTIAAGLLLIVSAAVVWLTRSEE